MPYPRLRQGPLTHSPKACTTYKRWLYPRTSDLERGLLLPKLATPLQVPFARSRKSSTACLFRV
ncbi:hypothetical protein NOVOSPHI9U_370029 [Novosphingobium sp. 9U]|nr:hypothetical protein NOVOSPHI9U_370029 [Novosphingobium sp. 9U]